VTDRPSGRPMRVTRKQLVRGMGAATLGGVVAGGAGGFFGGRSSSSEAATGARGEPITVGVLAPITGASAGDGQEMVRGLKLGAAMLNRNGGIGGREVKLQVLDARDQAPDVMTSAMRKFVSNRVAAIFAPFITTTNIELPIVGQARIPLFHVNTFQANVDYAIKHGYRNIFQGCPSEIWYAPGFVSVLDGLIETRQFTPRGKTASIVTANDAYSMNIARTAKTALTDLGWKVVQFDSYTAPQGDWTAVLTRVRRHNPDLLFHSDLAAGDEASLIKQFAQSPSKTLVYQQYAPSVPEYRQLSGSASDGVIWATTTGSMLTDEIGQRFLREYTRAYRQQPGLSNAGAQYDLMQLWGTAAGLTANPYDYDAVGRVVDDLTYRGVNGSYRLGPTQQTCLPYPSKVKDPTQGMPLLTFQIQDGKQVLISPDPYARGKFQLPRWLA
jgi:branched-chain amino acid transport system substrate-binding protein